jgi:uncharacterized membrane protein YfhO
MIRTIVTPKDQTISFNIPKKYIGKQIEVIAFSKDEEMVKEMSKQKKVSFNALAIDTRNYKFNRDEANER